MCVTEINFVQNADGTFASRKLRRSIEEAMDNTPKGSFTARYLTGYMEKYHTGFWSASIVSSIYSYSTSNLDSEYSGSRFGEVDNFASFLYNSNASYVLYRSN